MKENRSYFLNGDIGDSVKDVCLKLQGPRTRLDLRGYTVRGRITATADLSGIELFNGQVVCDHSDTGTADVGCIRMLSSSTVSGALLLQDLTVRNEAAKSGTLGGRSIHIDWSSTKRLDRPSIILKRIRSVVEDQPGVVRSSNINVNGLNQVVEVSHSDLRCGSKAQACQGVVCYDAARCLVHDNLLRMDENTTSETARAIVFDGCLSGEAWNNTIYAHNNRAVRVRDSVNIAVHDNLITEITAGIAAVHLGDPDFGTDHLRSSIFRNRFRTTNGTVFFARSVAEVDVYDNTVECEGKCEARFAVVRTPLPQPCPERRKARPGAACNEFKTAITFRDNAGVSTLPSPQIEVFPDASIILCQSGIAGGTVAGTGEIASCETGGER